MTQNLIDERSKMDTSGHSRGVSFDEQLMEEAREAGEANGAWIPDEVGALSPMFPHGDDVDSHAVTWAETYLLSVENMPRELRAVLLALSYSRLPWNLSNALTRHAIALGKDSPAYSYARKFWEEYHHCLWTSSEVREHIEAALNSKPTSTIAVSNTGDEMVFIERGDTRNLFPIARELALDSVLGGMRLRTPRFTYGLSRGVWIPWRRAEWLHSGGVDAEWGEILWDVATQERHDREFLASLSAIDAVESLQADGRFPGREEFMAEATINATRLIFSALDAEWLKSQYVPWREAEYPLATSIMLLQEHFTEELLLEFGAMVEEYNVEWALAAMEWNREPSKVVEALKHSVEKSPWSSEGEREEGAA